MSASFSRVSLLMQVNGVLEKSDAQAVLAMRGSDLHRARIIFHETVHYWQQLSQSFLIELASEEWGRLRHFEETGQVLEIGEMRREFDRVDKDLGFSARDLHECLARFWEVVAFGAQTIISDEWQSGRKTAHPDFEEMYRQRRVELELPPNAWGSYDFQTAMYNIGGDYASPFLVTCPNLPQCEMFVFPWLAHFALKTRTPVTIFGKLIHQLGESIAEHAASVLTSHDVPRHEQFSYAINEIAMNSYLESRKLVRREGEEMTPGLASFAESSLTENAAYAWAFEDCVVPAAQALAGSETVINKAGESGSKKSRFSLGVRLLDGFLATPGLEDSLTLIVFAGLAPPCIRYSNGDVISPLRYHRKAAIESVSKLSEDDVPNDLIAGLIPLLVRPNLEAAEMGVVDICVNYQDRWNNFTRAQRVRTSPGI
ncbi:hypothetical protein ACFQ7M_31195 [Streptomyces massasporeus]